MKSLSLIFAGLLLSGTTTNALAIKKQDKFSPINPAGPLITNLGKYKDPSTGKYIPGSTMLTLPNGKKITAAEYYADLNKHQSYLSSKGKTLYSSSSNLGTLKFAPSTSNLLVQQKSLISKDSTKYLISDNLLIANPVSKSTPSLDCEDSDAVRINKPWSKTAGNKDFGISINSSFFLYAKCDSTSSQGVVAASGTAFKHTKSLMSGYVNAQANDLYSLKAKLNVVGYDLYSYDKKTSSPIKVTENKSKSINLSGRHDFPIGPIVATVRYGVTGKAGIKFNSGISNLTASAEANPYVSADAFISGGVGVIIAEVGAEGRIKLINAQLNNKALVEITPRSGDLFLHESMFMTYKLDALSGKIVGYAEVPVPRWGIPPWKKKKYSEELYSWSGLSTSGTIKNQQLWYKLINN